MLGNRIKALREREGLKQDELAKKLSVSPSAIGMYETNKREPNNEIIIKLAEYFHVTTDYLLGKSDVNIDSNVFPINDTPVKVPVVGRISAGLPILAQENIEGYEFAPSSMIKEGFEYFYLKVQGDSMNLKFNDGDIVLVQKQDELENNEIGVILVNGYDATVKKYKSENGLVILEPMSTNPENTVQVYNPKDISIKIIGKVVSYQGKI
jgi:repressor LexA